MTEQEHRGNILIVGGSGFLSGTLAGVAMKQGYRVWTITRGQRPLPDGVQSLIVDRHDEERYATAVASTQTEWDMVVDCIGFVPADIEQDVAVFRQRTPHLVFISTDFVYDPKQRKLPQNEQDAYYVVEGYGADKRRCELALMAADTREMAWTILRPCHIYGPGSQLGCLPLHSRDEKLISRLPSG